MLKFWGCRMIMKFFWGGGLTNADITLNWPYIYNIVYIEIVILSSKNSNQRPTEQEILLNLYVKVFNWQL